MGSLPMHLTMRLRLLLIAWIWIGIGLPEAAAQSPPTQATAADRTTRGTVRSRIQDIEAREGLEEPLKKRLLEIYRQAQAHLEAAERHAASALSYKKAVQSAPSEIEKLDRALEQPEDVGTAASPPTDTPLPEIERRLLMARAELAGLQFVRGDLETEIQESQGRTSEEIQDEIAAAKEDLASLEKDFPARAGPQESPLVIEARRMTLQAHQQARSSEIHRLEQELLSHDIRIELLRARRDQVTEQVARAQTEVHQLEQLIASRRQSEAEEAQIAAERAQREAAGKHPAIRDLAEKNAEFSRELASIVKNLSTTTAERERTSKQLDQLEQDFQSVKQKLDIAGLSQALGQVLRESRRKLRELRWYREDAQERQEIIGEVGLAQLRIDERRRSLRVLNRALDRLMREGNTGGLPLEEQKMIRADLRGLVKDQRELLSRLADTYTDYLRALGDLDVLQKQLLNQEQQYALFLDERLVWIPSARPVGLAILRDLALATGWMLSPLSWAESSETLIAPALRTPFWVAFAVLLFGALFLVRRRARLTLGVIAEQVSRPYSDRFILTVQALGLTLLVAAPWPLLLYFLGWNLEGMAAGSEFTRALGTAFQRLAVSLFLFHTFYLLCRPKGIAELHLGWQEQPLRLFRRHLPWLMLIVLPAVFVTSMAGWEAEETYRDSLGRVAFIISLFAFAVFLQRLLRPEGGALEAHLKEHPHRWLARLRVLWYPIAIGLPLVLVGLAAAGYYYTALQLESQLVATVWLIAGAVIAHDLAIRWLTVENRKHALIKAQEQRTAARAAEAAKAGAGAAGEGVPEQLDVPEIDIPTIDRQTRHLLRTLIVLSAIVGLWLIWAEVLPALRILDTVTVWQYAVVTDGQDRMELITLADLALAVVLAIIVGVAVRNVPGVLEVALLRRLSIEPGSRYAITQIARYVIAIVGVIVVFNTIGGQWSQVQWLVAALSVGLGFGLQEIFGNFVSGLILLFERPVRMGDVVTVKDITGTVTRIRIRATTITDADKRELIVPNKTLITGEVINWTLSDTTTRVVIPVSIDYRADLALAHRVIFDAVRAHPLSMPNPDPAVVIVGFAEGAINIEARVFVRELAQRALVDHELRLAIHDKLRAHHIETPLPERTVNVRSFVPIQSQGSEKPREAQRAGSGVNPIDRQEDP